MLPGHIVPTSNAKVLHANIMTEKITLGNGILYQFPFLILEDYLTDTIQTETDPCVIQTSWVGYKLPGRSRTPINMNLLKIAAITF